MDVYAEYFVENNLTYRRNTILQFGNSWELIGNIVLANPGSAKPRSDLTQESFKKLKEFYKKYRLVEAFNSDHWREFSVDSTMNFVEKIFNGEYVGKRKKLNGVIQLFNTFNIKNQNLEEALANVDSETDLMFSTGIEKCFHKKPTYFGFSKKVLENKTLRKVAKDIFNNSSDVFLSIYEKEFSNNIFYHPMYVNRAHDQSHFKWYKDHILRPLVSNI